MKEWLSGLREFHKKRRNWLLYLFFLLIGPLYGLIEHWLYSTVLDWLKESKGPLLFKSAGLWLIVHPLLWGVVLVPVTFCAIAIVTFIKSARHAERGQSKQDESAKKEATLKIIDEAVQDAKRAGNQAALLWHYAACAKSLEQRLVEVWHHFIDAGESLVHPIGGKVEWKNWSMEKMKLADERRDFMVLYMTHLEYLKEELPGFSSGTTEIGYPSDTEYVDVLRTLRDHIQKLEEYAQRIWDAESPSQSLIKVKQP
jgi:hypothetical protein